MPVSLEKKLRAYSRPYLTDMELATLMNASTLNSRYSKVKRLLAEGKLQQIRRGLYCLTNEIGYPIKPHPYELAQFIYGPSFISFESALSFHQLIPEGVYTTTSATLKRTKEFITPLGVFSYRHLPLQNFYNEVEIIEMNGYKFLMAKPWRAICDYIYNLKLDWKNVEPLLKSLRIEWDSLPPLTDASIISLDEYYHCKKVSQFLNGAQGKLF